MNKYTTIKIIPAFTGLVELFQMVLNHCNLPLFTAKMLSSRFSAKSYSIEDFCAGCLIQPRRRVVINWVRARNADSEKAQATITELILKYQGGKGMQSNQQKMQITLNKSKINFVTLNEEKQKVQQSGGKIGLPIERDAEYIFNVFEECSQLNQMLVENMRDSTRGNVFTQILSFYISNPGKRDQGFVDQFIKGLPENREMEEELLTRGYNSRFDENTKTLYFRPRYTLNRHVPKENIREIELLKETNINKGRIVSLGYSGTLQTAIYEASLKRLKSSKEPYIGQRYFGGVDWGDGKSSQASPTVSYFGGISLESGIDLYAEQIGYNNRGVVLSTEDQIKKVCQFFIKHFEIVRRPITVHLDSASLGDFWNMFQNVLSTLGYSANQIEFLPANKPKNTGERVETVNAMMSMGILRYNKDVCKGLYTAMENCYEIQKTNPTESTKRDRSHEGTHWLHALEYLIDNYMKDFQQMIPRIITESKSNGYYGVY